MDIEPIEALLRAALPAVHGRLRLELAGPGLDLAPDGCLTVRLCLHNDGTGESGEQTVELVPAAAAQDPERAHAFAEAWVRSLPSLLACVAGRTGGRSVAPSMLEFAHRTLEHGGARTTAEFVGQLTDPPTLRAWAAAADAAHTAEWVREECRDLGLGGHADALVALCRTGIQLSPGGEAATRTHLGGLPDLPPGTPWPHRRRRPMTFLAQFDLAEIGPCDDDRLLPPAGLLQIFADLTGDTAWDDAAHGPGVLVVTRPDTRELVGTAPPAGAGTFPRRAVIPSVDVSLPPLDSPFYRDLTELDLTGSDPAGPSPEYAAFIDFLNEFHPPMDDDDRPRHRLLGYADPLQNDPWEQCATAGVPATRWQLLAQLDSEPDAPLGDNGVIYVLIPRDALAAGDFTKATGVWQTH